MKKAGIILAERHVLCLPSANHHPVRLQNGLPENTLFRCYFISERKNFRFIKVPLPFPPTG